jgi:tripartite-type tricarboxylate transporter receptor subunit TctC
MLLARRAVSVFRRSGLAQETFYKGKTLTFLVGAPPGGGFDTMTRIVARHIARHLAGNPIVVVQNMTGAGTLNHRRMGG